MKANLDVRERIKRARVKHWEVANCLGVSEQTLMRWLRVPLSDEKKRAIFAVVEAMERGRMNNG